MAVTLITEDGTGLANANSLVTLAEYQAYALSRGLTIGDTEDKQIVELIKGGDYINSKRARYQGSKTFDIQSMQFPRIDVYIDGILIPQNIIPEEAKISQMEAGIYSVNNDLNGKTSLSNIQEDKTGPLTTKYFKGATVNLTQSIDVNLSVLYKPMTSGIKRNNWA